MKVIFYVVVHGDHYANYFFDIQVPSIVNQTIYPDIKKYFQFQIYTKKESLDNPLFRSKLENLKSLVNVELFLLPDLPHEQGFENRYKYLCICDEHANSIARTNNALLMPANSTYVFGNNYFESAINKISTNDHDAVLILPPRALGECFNEWFSGKVVDGDSLFEYFKTYISPNLIASEWDQPFGANEHFFLNWYHQNQMVLRSLGYPPAILKPYTLPDHLRTHTIDTKSLDIVKNPYVSSDFQEFPMLNLMMLNRYYHFRPRMPYLAGVRKSVDIVGDWLVRTALLSNRTPKVLFYMLNSHLVCKFSHESINHEAYSKSVSTANEIKHYIKNKYNINWL
ncbi:MAG: hypothetical protein K9J78_06825 [Polynucleobacter sp.]|nr:hypothetical protein [Polynucleobacter sp.]